MDDGRVSPNLQLLEAWVTELNVTRVLVLGEPSDEIEARVMSLQVDARWTSHVLARHIPGGLVAYRGLSDDEWIVTVSLIGVTASASRAWRWNHLSHDDSLDRVSDLVETMWDSARQVRGHAEFEQGDVVRVTGSGAIGRVKNVRRVGDAFEYAVFVDGQEKQLTEASLTKEHGDPRDPEHWLTLAPASAESIAVTLTWTKLHHPMTDVIYSFRSSRTIFRSYQFRPVLKIINSDNRRLLIADEVGLGKTIEAGLVWNELEQRGEVRSVLIVCPSTLRYKWQQEMRNRFDRKVRILTKADLETWVTELEQGEGRDFQGIVSLELLRVSATLDRLEALSPRLDLVIVDEAHYLRNTGTKSNSLGALLTEWSDALLFLSATPLNLHQADLFNLLHLLDEEAFPTIELMQEQVGPNRAINTAARLLLGEGRRKPAVVREQLEKLSEFDFGRLLQELPDYKQLLALLKGPGGLSYEAIAQAKRHLMELHTLAPIFTRTRKIDTSEAKAIREPHDRVVQWTVEEREFYEAVHAYFAQRAAESGQISGFMMQMPLRQAASCLPAMQQTLQTKGIVAWSDEDDPDIYSSTDDTPSSSLLSRALKVDSKYDLFLKTVKESMQLGSGQVLVFSFFRGTLEYLDRRLSADLAGIARVGLMYGPTPPAEREVRMNEFRSGKIDILLCSEVGSEGLDFQFCNALVNYDLPWNPMRIEQRIGRLDRFGQKSDKIFIFNMQVPGTIETDILSRLYDRIGVFRETIGDLEPILRELDDAIVVALDPKLSPAQRSQRMAEINVALESRKKDIDELSTTDSLIGGIGDLLVDGFEDDSPGGGRFIGRDELTRFITHYLRQVGGELRSIDGYEHAVQVRGGARLVQALRSKSATPQSVVSPASLATAIENDGLTLTFDEREAVERGLPLVNAQHPLVGVAVDYLAADDIVLERYGVVRILDLKPKTEVLTGIFLVETLGLRPSLELLCIAVDQSGAVVDGVGEQVLSALAHGRLLPDISPVRLSTNKLFKCVDALRAEHLRELERERSSANDALIERRLSARRREFELKIGRAKDTLQMVISDRRRDSVIRLNEARIANLETKRNQVLGELEAKRGFSISSTPIAVLVVRP